MVDLNNANNIIAITPFDTPAFKDARVIDNTTYYYTVTALDRFHNESIPSNTAILTTGTVPLQLLDFSVNRLDKEHVKIQWWTAQEDHVENFIALRSLDGFNFSPVGSVAARNSGRTEFYSLTDLIPGAKGIIYYKLKIRDQDGGFRYSAVRTINIGKDIEWVKVFPTILQKGAPLQVRIISTGQGMVYYNLFDGGGKKIGNGVMNNSGFINTWGLEAGRYVIQFLQGDRYRSMQFVIQ